MRPLRLSLIAIGLASLLAGCAAIPTASPRATVGPPEHTVASSRSPRPPATAAPGASPAFLELRAVYRAGAATATLVETVAPPTSTTPAGWDAGFAPCADSPAASPVASPRFLHVEATVTVSGSWPASAPLDLGDFTLTPRTVWAGPLQPMQAYCTDVAGPPPFTETADLLVDAAADVDDQDGWGGASWWVDVADGVSGVTLASCSLTLSPTARAQTTALARRSEPGRVANGTRCGADPNA